MTWPSVSIGIPTHNRAEIVRRAIQSALFQDYRGPLEVVVVDDGSTDNTEAVVRALLAGPYEDRVRYHKCEHSGIAHAKNLCLTLATGELRGILDSDDFYGQSFVRRCVETLIANPEVGLVYTDNYLVTENSSGVLCCHANEWNEEVWLKTCNLRGDCWLARWDVIRKTALHDERMRLDVDYDLFYQLAKLTPFRRIPECLQTVSEHGKRSSADRMEAAYWHAAGLAKHRHGIEYALQRAARHGKSEEWVTAIQRGYAFGRSLRSPLCDIVLLTHGQPEHTGRCLDSLANSDRIMACRIIWVDNASVPGEREMIAAKLAAMPCPHLAVYQTENIGFVRGTNAGLALSTAPYVLLLNNDTEVPRDWFPKFLEVFEREVDVGIVGPLADNPRQWQGEHARILAWEAIEGQVGYRIMYWPDAMLSFFCAMIRRETFRQVGYLNETFGAGLGDDDEYSWRARRARWRLALRTDVTVKHHYRTTFDAVYGPEKRIEMEAAGVRRFREVVSAS